MLSNGLLTLLGQHLNKHGQGKKLLLSTMVLPIKRCRLHGNLLQKTFLWLPRKIKVPLQPETRPFLFVKESTFGGWMPTIFCHPIKY